MDVACLALWSWLAAASLIGFALAVHDKGQARRSGRRVRERTLWLWALVGGWPGLLLAFIVVRHKTRKARFLVPFLICIAASLSVVLAARMVLSC